MVTANATKLEGGEGPKTQANPRKRTSRTRNVKLDSKGNILPGDGGKKQKVILVSANKEKKGMRGDREKKKGVTGLPPKPNSRRSKSKSSRSSREGSKALLNVLNNNISPPPPGGSASPSRNNGTKSDMAIQKCKLGSFELSALGNTD